MTTSLATATPGQIRAMHAVLISRGTGPGRHGNVGAKHIRWGIPEIYRGQPVDEAVAEMPRDVASRVLDHMNSLPWLEARRWDHRAVLTGDPETIARLAAALGTACSDGARSLRLDRHYAWKRVVSTAVAEGIRLRKVPATCGVAA